MRTPIRSAILASTGVVVLLSAAVRASSKTMMIPTNAVSVRLQQPAAPDAWKSEFQANYDETGRKMMQLATVTPWAKYAWRPGKGVRSICEVFLHVAGANYEFGGPIGIVKPAGLDVEKMEKCPATKDAVLATMKTGYANMRAAVTALPAASADDQVNLFGSKMTKRAMLLFTAEHAGEHLGQAIAYSRMNRIVPPWSK